MATDSRINPNFPIPGIDQSSRGFRDNFTVTKREIEQLQNTTIQLAGAITSAPVVFGSSATNALVIDTSIAGGSISLDPPNLAVQFNLDGRLTGLETFVFSDNTLGIGTSAPNPSYAVDVRGSAAITGNLMLGSADAASVTVQLDANGTMARLYHSAEQMALGTDAAIPLYLESSGQPRVTIAVDGRVGIGTTLPLAKLELNSSDADLARFITDQTLTDSMIRAVSQAPNSTIAWGLEHTQGNWSGGIRINQQGTVSIHSGENASAQLSTSSARISINNAGKVGIGSSQPSYTIDVNGTLRSNGITDTSDDFIIRVGINNGSPEYELDVKGDISLSGAIVSRIPGLTLDDTLNAIDTWPMTTYRSARYTIQISRGSSPGEQVDLIECMVTHADQIPVLKVIDSISTGISLGSITVGADPIDPSYAVLSYQGTAPLDRVRLAKTYLEI
jgi:hypothetical protein